MQRTAKLDGTREMSYSPVTFIHDPRGMTAEELMKMREQGMSNSAIARAVNSKSYYIEKLIGKTPPEIIKAIQQEHGRGLAAARAGKKPGPRKKKDKTPPAQAAEPPRVSLGKQTFEKLKPIFRTFSLEGEIANYEVNMDGEVITVISKDTQKPMMVVSFNELEPFIEELMDVFTAAKDVYKEVRR